MDELDLTDVEKKTSYQKIKDHVLEHGGLKLYIAHVKRKCGIIENIREKNRPCGWFEYKIKEPVQNPGFCTGSYGKYYIF